MLIWVLTLYLANGTCTSSSQRAMDVRNGYKPIISYDRCVELAKEKELIMNNSITNVDELTRVRIICKRVDSKTYYANRHKQYTKPSKLTNKPNKLSKSKKKTKTQ